MAVRSRSARTKSRTSTKRNTKTRAASSQTRRTPRARGKPVAGAPVKTHLPKITYASLTLTENDHSAYESAVGHARENMGEHYPSIINGRMLRAQEGNEQA